ncbi:hypothetical protein JW805_06140 [Roseomonas aeriglobus]|nr:hypothetical protein [Roseomonas aeriglobus]
MGSEKAKGAKKKSPKTAKRSKKAFGLYVSALQLLGYLLFAPSRLLCKTYFFFADAAKANPIAT